MATRDLFNNLSPVSSITPAAQTSDANGTGVDLAGYEGALVLAHVGAEGDTLSGSVTISAELEESSDDSTYSDVADADMLGETGNGSGQFALANVAADANGKVYKAGYQGGERYIRVVDNVTGTHSNGTIFGAIVLRGVPAHAPVGDTANPS